MYIPEAFQQTDVGAMHERMRADPLATLVNHSSHGLNANHLPLHLLDAPAPYGTLQGHVSRANPLAAQLEEEGEVLAVFHGPDGYVSPSWYPTKQETGKAVPTWNYAVVHAYGTVRLIKDAVWLREHLERLTNHHEAAFPEPWAVSDAPAEFSERLMGHIVGIEIAITRLEGKWKASQNQPPNNRAGVVEGLRAMGRDGASAMAELIEKAGEKAR